MRLNISSRTIIGFLIMAAILVIVDLVSIYYTNRLQEIAEKIMAENVTSFVAAKELQLALMDQKGLTTSFLLTSDEQWLRKFDAVKATFYDWFHRAQKASHTPEERQILEKIRHSYESYLDRQRHVVTLQTSGRTSDAQVLLLSGMRAAFDTVSVQCERLWDINERLMKEAERRLAHTNTTVNRIMYGVMIGGGLLGLFLGIVISRSITRPIYELVLKVRGATEREEIVQNVEIANESELEQLGHSVRLLIENIHQTNEELARSQQLLIRSEKLATAGQLAAGIAHEIRNPLTTVKMLTFALEEELSPRDDRRKDLRMIIGEIERMEGVLQSFLDFARPPEPEFTRMTLTQTIEHALALLHPEIRKREIHPSLDIPHDITICADRSQVSQVLINLLMNAIDAMPDGGDLRLTVRPVASPPAEAKPMVEIGITDTGTGIPDDLFPHLFDPFVTRKDGGTGLGLSIAHKIVETHGGWIEAKNNPNGGATFTVTLPMEQ
jgi:signal transduction histidine kinase